MHTDRFRISVKLTCADCGLPLRAGERAEECPLCKRWPLCGSCMSTTHGRSVSGADHMKVKP